MKRRRPTAADRDLADYVRSLSPGETKIVVEEVRHADLRRGFGLVRPKHEGSMEIEIHCPDNRPVTRYITIFQ